VLCQEVARFAGAHAVPLRDAALRQVHLIDEESPAPVALAGPFLGAPQAAMGLEKLIALGCARFWVLGWCGSLQPELRIGQLVLPQRALSEEGTSAHYPTGHRPPASDAGLNETLRSALRARGAAFAEGAVWTTDAPYRETVERVRRHRAAGVLAVEMEMSALMTVALYHGVRLAGLLAVSDELFELKWNPGFSDPRLHAASRAAAEVLLQAARSRPATAAFPPPSAGGG
jgi:uridine phosphorylase